MSKLNLSNIDEYVSGSKRTDVIEIVNGEQKTFVSNLGLDATNYQFTCKVEFFTAGVSYQTDGAGNEIGISINTFVKNTSAGTIQRDDMIIKTQSNPGIVEFRIPENLVPVEIDVPIDSASPLMALASIRVNTDTLAAFPSIHQESVLIVVRYSAR